MERRAFFKASAATAAALAAQGYLPLLAADGSRRKAGAKKASGKQISANTHTRPSAIEPVTGYLPAFTPTVGAAMAGTFKARYALVAHNGASGTRSRNKVSGAIDMVFGKERCRTVETREGKKNSSVKTIQHFSGALNSPSKWTLISTVEGRKDLAFTEEGTWRGRTMTVTSKSWKQQRETRNPLVHRWALLPLLASGTLKKKPLTFDMLDDSALRPDQTLRYEGEITIPVKGGPATVDSYVQTGAGIVPTHYLVDSSGRVQLITMTTVNWVLTA